MDAGIKMDGVLLDDDLLLDQGVDLRLEEVALVNVIGLQLKVIFLQVGDVFDDFFENIIGRLSGVMFQGGTLASEELHFLLVVIQQFDGILSVSLY